MKRIKQKIIYLWASKKLNVEKIIDINAVFFYMSNRHNDYGFENSKKIKITIEEVE